MKKYLVRNATSKFDYGDKVLLASSVWDRLIGLMFKKEMQDSRKNFFDGLILDPCNSIHTCFMRFDIDVIFLDSSNQIIKIYQNLKPWRMTPLFWKARKVIEFKAGKIRTGIINPINNNNSTDKMSENISNNVSCNNITKLGDKVEFICIN